MGLLSHSFPILLSLSSEREVELAPPLFNFIHLSSFLEGCWVFLFCFVRSSKNTNPDPGPLTRSKSAPSHFLFLLTLHFH